MPLHRLTYETGVRIGLDLRGLVLVELGLRVAGWLTEPIAECLGSVQKGFAIDCEWADEPNRRNDVRRQPVDQLLDLRGRSLEFERLPSRIGRRSSGSSFAMGRCARSATIGRTGICRLVEARTSRRTQS